MPPAPTRNNRAGGRSARAADSYVDTPPKRASSAPSIGTIAIVSALTLGVILALVVLFPTSGTPAAPSTARGGVRGDAAAVAMRAAAESLPAAAGATTVAATAVYEALSAPPSCPDCPACAECEECAARDADATHVRLSVAGGPPEPLPAPAFAPSGADAAECSAFLAQGHTGKRGGEAGAFTTFTSQFGQDAYIYRNYFAGRARGQGFYVDVGANAPKELSNTWFFDKCLGWKGLCVEASPTRSAQLKEQRSCKVVNNCVWETDKTMHLSGTDANSINDHLAAGGFPIQCKTINDILAAEKVPHIDFFSLDIESAEPQALRGMDFTRFGPDVMVIETFWLNQTVHNTMFDNGAGRGCGRAGAGDAIPLHPPPSQHPRLATQATQSRVSSAPTQCTCACNSPTYTTPRGGRGGATILTGFAQSSRLRAERSRGRVSMISGTQASRLSREN